MQKIEYSKLLHTKEWRAKRLLILKRDNFQCTCCHKKEIKLYVHHTYYNMYSNGEMINPWEYPNEALISLCYICHRKVHSTNRTMVHYIPRIV